jgi:hypothetical protein
VEVEALRWTDPPPKESYQMSRGSISKKKNPKPEKGIRKKEEEEEAVSRIGTPNYKFRKLKKNFSATVVCCGSFYSIKVY